MAWELEGSKDLQNDLTRMAMEIDSDSVIRKVLKEGAKPIETQMKANAASDPQKITGDLHRALGTVVRPASKQVTMGVHRKDWDKEDYYPAYVEFGHGGPAPAPAHPYIRPAFDTKKEEAYTAMKNVLRDAIDRNT